MGSPIEGYYCGTVNPAIHQLVHFRTLLHRMRLTTSLAVGLIAVIILNTNQTLLIDLVPDQGSSITACVRAILLTTLNDIKLPCQQNNLVRCSMGAVMVSVINPILVALDDGWTYTVLGGLCVLASPLVYVEIRWGPVWRERRRQKQSLVALNCQ